MSSVYLTFATTCSLSIPLSESSLLHALARYNKPPVCRIKTREHLADPIFFSPVKSYISASSFESVVIHVRACAWNRRARAALHRRMERITDQLAPLGESVHAACTLAQRWRWPNSIIRSPERRRPRPRFPKPNVGRCPRTVSTEAYRGHFDPKRRESYP